MKAVILAAGTSSRLRPLTDTTPKTLLSVGDTPILHRMLSGLSKVGFDHFVIITGYLEHMIRESVSRRFPDLPITFVTNPDYSTTNNAYSLLLARDVVENDAFVLFDGDVVFDIRIVEQLLARGGDCLAVRSVGDIGDEEMKVTADETGRILAISKELPPDRCLGESMSIQLFSPGSAKQMFRTLHQRVIERGLVHEYYEHSIQQALEDGLVTYGVDIGTMYAWEIDTPEDLQVVDAWVTRHGLFDLAAPDRGESRLMTAK